jgi:hypothetical protein
MIIFFNGRSLIFRDDSHSVILIDIIMEAGFETTDESINNIMIILNTSFHKILQLKLLELKA